MYTVHILKDDFGKLYKGTTNDLSRRLQEHRREETMATREMKNINLIYKEE
jgi:predicted GIY-YIG superfamily endonuclease